MEHRGVDPDKLTGEVARQFDLQRSMHRTFGSRPEWAWRHAIDDLLEAGWIKPSRFEVLVDSFRQPGVSEAEAKRAAIGRHGSEYEARRVWDGPSSETSLTETSAVSLPPARPAAAEVLWREAARYLGEAKEPGVSAERRDWLCDTAERLAQIAREVESGGTRGGASKATESKKPTGTKKSVTLTELRPQRGGRRG